MIYDTIIIGGGPAGLTAAIYALRAHKSVLLIERMAIGGQVALTNLIENYPGFEAISGFELADKMFHQAEKFGLKTVYSDVISYDIKGETKKITTHEGVFEGKTVILALGAAARQLDVVSEKEFAGRGISYCATCDGNFYKNKVVAVVGGGNSSLSSALYLSNIASKVYLVHRRDSFKAEAVQVDKVMELTKGENPKITFLPFCVVQDLEGNGKVESMIIENLQDKTVKEIPVDGVFVAIGRKPDTALLQGVVDLNDGGYIITDDEMHTNVEGVFAVGDVRHKGLKQIVTACGDGAIAATEVVEYLNKK